MELQFGNFEKFIGDGSSVKNAQRNAAVVALQNTQFGFPRVHYAGHQQNAQGGPWNGGSFIQTPASELNTLMMKKGVQPKYELTAEKQVINEPTESAQYLPEYDNLFYANQSHNFYPSTKTPLLPSPGHRPKGHQSFNHKMWQPAMPQAPAYSPHNGYFIPRQPPPPYMIQPATFIQPNQHSPHFNYSFPYRAPVSSHHSHCNVNNDYSPANQSYHHLKHSNVDKWNLYPASYLSPGHINKFNNTTTNFEAKLEIEGQQFTGQGRTVQSARHSAANEALKTLKVQKSQQTSAITVGQPSQKISTLDADEQSPVSLIYEYASRNRFEVLFETIRESGEVHLRLFLVRCSLFKDASKHPFIIADGEDRSKKAAKRVAAQTMLNKLKEKGGTDSPCKDAGTVSSTNKVLSRPKVKLSVISGEQQQKPQTIVEQEQNTTENISADSTTMSCRFVTLLYTLTRNMSISHPIYQSSTSPETDVQLTESFKACVSDDDDQQQSSLVIHKAECSVTFEQRLPKHFTCQLSAIGYGSSARVAKSIATYICLLKLGVALPPFETGESNSSVAKMLNFSLSHNLNVPEVSVSAISLDEAIVSGNVDESVAIDSSSELMLKSASDSIEQNLQFIIHILGKLYLFTLKNSTKSLECIFDKLETSLMTFYATKYPLVAASVVAIKCELLEKAVHALADRKLYWSHLELISALVLLGVDTGALDNGKEPFLHFKSHIFSATDKHDSSTPFYGSLITGHCDAILAGTFNFSLVRKNFINFGLGASENAARETASYWVLKNLAYQARKQIIENEYVETTEPLQPKSSPTSSKSVNQHRPEASTPTNKSTTVNARSPKAHQNASMNKKRNELSKSSSKSTSSTSSGTTKTKSKSSNASHSQIISKECIGQLFKAATELNIRKPAFESETLSPGATILNPEKLSLAPNLFSISCSLTFIQDVPDQLTAKMATYAIAPSQRVGRTICAFLALSKLGLSHSLPITSQLSAIEDFEAYLGISQCNSALFPSHPNHTDHSSQLQSQKMDFNAKLHLMTSNAEEIGRNLDFVIHLLQEVYRPFLKNHKMSCPSPLMGRIERELFEYHNHQQQILDESTAFDRCSAHIEKSIGDLVRRFDGTQFWDHLQLLSSIASLLTANLAQPLVPSPLTFNCSLSKCAESSQSKQTGAANQTTQQSASSASVSVAIITVSSCLPQAHDLAQKSCLSFSLGETEPMARERAAYKALRQLAINLWK